MGELAAPPSAAQPAQDEALEDRPTTATLLRPGHGRLFRAGVRVASIIGRGDYIGAVRPTG